MAWNTIFKEENFYVVDTGFRQSGETGYLFHFDSARICFTVWYNKYRLEGDRVYIDKYVQECIANEGLQDLAKKAVEWVEKNHK